MLGFYEKSFPQGRFCNVLLQNLGLSIIGKKLNLKCNYNWTSLSDGVFELKTGLKNNFNFFEGGKKLSGSPVFYCDDTLEKLLNLSECSFPIEYSGFFQKKCLLYEHKNLVDECINKNDITHKNQVFVHVRLGDQQTNTAGYEYYKKVLDDINFTDGLISSDSSEHEIVIRLKNEYDLTFYDNPDFQDVIMLASQFDYRVVTGGSSGWIIGYLGNNNNVYYVKNEYPNHIKYWPQELFSEPFWKGY